MILNADPFPWLGVGLWAVVGVLYVVQIWWLTARIAKPWIRTFLRAGVIAVVFTPVTLYCPGRIGDFLVPAWYAWYSAIREASLFFFLLGAVPVAIVTGILWAVGMAVYWVRKSRSV